MPISFIHQNIPGRFKHLIAHFGAMSGIEMWAPREAKRVRGNRSVSTTGVHLRGYVFNKNARDVVDRRLNSTDVNVHRPGGRKKSRNTKCTWSRPDVVSGQPDWGEMLFVVDVFPRAKIVNYCEFYFNSEGQAPGFDPEFPTRPALRYEMRAQNLARSQSLFAKDLGISSTCWKKVDIRCCFGSKVKFF